MVLLPALKIGLMLEPRKKHTQSNKLTNIRGVSDVEFSAESNGITHRAKKTARNGLKNKKWRKKKKYRVSDKKGQ